MQIKRKDQKSYNALDKVSTIGYTEVKRWAKFNALDKV